MFSASTFGATTFGGSFIGPTHAADAESTLAVTETDTVGVGRLYGSEGAGEHVWLNPEGNTPGYSGAFGSGTFGSGGFSGAQVIAGDDWSLYVRTSDAESTLAISETEAVVQSIVLNLGAGGASFIAVDSLGMDWELNQRARCSFLVKYPGDAASFYVPRPGHRVKILGYDSTTVLFHGSIESTSGKLYYQQDGAHKLWTQCVAVGWEQIADRRVIADQAHMSYTGTLKAIIEDLVATYLAGDGVTCTGLPTGPTLSDELVFSYQTVSEAFDELSKRTGYWWRISTDKNVEFYLPSAATVAPLAITASSNNYISLESSVSRANYRNTQILLSVMVLTATLVEEFHGDSALQTFPTAYPLDQVPTVTLNAAAQTVGIRGLDTGKDWYWSKASNEISQDAAGTPIALADTLVVTYIGQSSTVVRRQDAAEVADRIAIEGGTGIYEDVAGDGVALTSLAGAQAYADALIARNAPIPSVVTIETDEIGMTPGSYIPIELPKLGLSGDFFVSKVSAEDVGGIFLRYTIECSSNEPEASWREKLAPKAPAKDLTSSPTSGF